jgi:hypothetical protein
MQLQSKVAVSPHSLQPHIDPHHTASEAYRVGGHVHPKAGALVSADHPSPTYSIPLTSLFPVQLSTSHQITSTLHNLLPHHIKTPSLPPSNQTHLFKPTQPNPISSRQCPTQPVPNAVPPSQAESLADHAALYVSATSLLLVKNRPLTVVS